jgi:hypothetical protein
MRKQGTNVKKKLNEQIVPDFSFNACAHKIQVVLVCSVPEPEPEMKSNQTCSFVFILFCTTL